MSRADHKIHLDRSTEFDAANESADIALRRAGPARRSQFVLGPDFIGGADWQHLDLGDKLRLSAQQDLEVTQVESHRCKLTMLGFMLSWSHPERSNKAILDALMADADGFEATVAATNEIGGRWILIYQAGSEIRLVHDAGGLRQVCYAERAGTVWCASQAALLAEASSLVPDADARRFIVAQSESDPEYWWPGDTLPYHEARALLPNHWLDIRSANTQRFWPNSEAASCRKELRDVRDLAARRLAGILQAAALRSPLALGLSAGWDSRVLLAASRSVIDEMVIYTARPPTMQASHCDFDIPCKLSKKLSLNHEIVVHPEVPDPRFEAVFESHTYKAHPRFAAGLQAEFLAFQYSKLAVIGNFSEVARLPYRHLVEDGQGVDVGDLARIAGMSDSPFAHQAFESWMPADSDLHGYHVLDLFYWEQRIGRWLAANCIEFDVGWQDVLVPFNIRSLIADLLACDAKHRDKNQPAVYVEIMKSLWPEVLELPINPKPRRSLIARLKSRVRRLLR